MLTRQVRRAHNLSIGRPICQPIFTKGIELAGIGADANETATLPETGPMTVPVDAARGSAWIADQLRQAIVEGTYKFGQKLPAERQLAEAFNASRTTVRLALDRLEIDKLVARRIGSGTFVSYRQPGETDDIAEITSPLELIEARLAIEPYMTRLAVLNASARDLEKLFEACDLAEAAGNDSSRFTEWDTQFHIRDSGTTRSTGRAVKKNAFIKTTCYSHCSCVSRRNDIAIVCIINGQPG